MKLFLFFGLLDILSSTVHLQEFKTAGRTHKPTNCKPIARGMTRFSIPMLIKFTDNFKPLDSDNLNKILGQKSLCPVIAI